MKLRRTVSITTLFCIICGLLMGFASAATAGSKGDPLISKSYLDNNYPPIVFAEPQQLLSESIQVLNYKLRQAKDSKHPNSTIYTLDSGGRINLTAGSGLFILSGGAELSSCDGTLIDLTTGLTLRTGQALEKSHQYLAAENTKANVTMTGISKVTIFGSAEVLSENISAFTDVSENSWYYDYVIFAVKKGLINGRSDSIYDPETNLSIAEAIKIAACMHQLYDTGSITLKNSLPWYDSYVKYALNNGITTRTYTNYDTRISRSEFVSIFYRSMPSSEYKLINTIGDNSIPDVNSSDTHASYIYAFYRAGIVIGNDNLGTFYPNANIRRSEVAAIITRMYDTHTRKQITLS